MPRQRNYRAEYEARKARAQTEGFTGYGQARGHRERQIEHIILSDPIFGGLPEDQRTRANAILYRQGYLYTGAGKPEQRRARKKLTRLLGGNLDIGVWTDYYKDVIYPSLTGKQYPGWTPMTVDRLPTTPDEWDKLMRESRISPDAIDEADEEDEEDE